MGRNYKRKPGTRSHRDYTEESMTAAIQAHKKGLSLRQAAAKYNVTKDSLSRRLKSDKIPKLGKLAQCKKLHQLQNWSANMMILRASNSI
mgnify:CR=1 FL=1